MQQRIPLERGIHLSNGDSHALDADKLIDGNVDEQNRQNQRQQGKQHTPSERFRRFRVKKIAVRLIGSEMRSMLRRKRVIAAAALRGSSVHNQNLASTRNEIWNKASFSEKTALFRI